MQDYNNPSWLSMLDREISPEVSEFLSGTRLAESLVEIPILHGLAHEGLFFSHF